MACSGTAGGLFPTRARGKCSRPPVGSGRVCCSPTTCWGSPGLHPGPSPPASWPQKLVPLLPPAPRPLSALRRCTRLEHEGSRGGDLEHDSRQPASHTEGRQGTRPEIGPDCRLSHHWATKAFLGFCSSLAPVGLRRSPRWGARQTPRSHRLPMDSDRTGRKPYPCTGDSVRSCPGHAVEAGC